MSRQKILDEQLSLPLADLDEAGMLAVLHARGANQLRRVRFKRNRSRMVSLSADQTSLNLQECFRAAPGPVIDAIAVFVTASSNNTAFRRAVTRMRRWWDGQESDVEHAARVRPALRSCATPGQAAVVATLYERLNRTRFDGLLPPDIPLRVSNRMSRGFGHIQYTRRGAVREVVEIALNVDLFLRGNERHLEETLLHEMAHAEAWLQHGHRGHGTIWRAIARRVGCEPRALSRVRIRRRVHGTRVTDVPAIAAGHTGFRTAHRGAAAASAERLLPP